MEPDEWTPASAWMIVLRKAGVRAAIIFAGLTVFLYLAWPVICGIFSLGMHGMLFLIPLVIVLSVAGFVLGHVVVRGLKEDSALGGWLLLVPMLVFVTVAEVAACYLAAALRSGSPAMMIVPLCAMIFWGWAACFAKLILM